MKSSEISYQVGSTLWMDDILHQQENGGFSCHHWVSTHPFGGAGFLPPTAQVGSIVTVGALSLIDAFSFGPRILGGFLGQLLCLAAILGFRWGSKGLGNGAFFDGENGGKRVKLGENLVKREGLNMC